MSYRLLKVSALSAIPADYSMARTDLFQATIGLDLVGVPLSSVKMEFQEFAAYLNSTTNTDATWVSAGVDIYSANDGNIGVGGVNPPEKLSVFGSISASAALSAVGPASQNYIAGRLGVGTTAQKTLFEIVSSGSVSQGTGMRIVDTNEIGSQYIGFDAADNTQTMAFYIEHYNSHGTLSGDVVIGNDAAIRMRDGGVATGHTWILTGGEVGIGTNVSPLATVHIKDNTGETALRVEDTAEDGVPAITLDNDTRAWKIRVDGADATQADSLKVSDDGGDKVTIDTAGQVGIGVTNPGARLDVDGTVKVQDDDASTNYITIAAPGTFNAAGANPFVFEHSGVESFRFVDGPPPRIGLNTTLPNAEVHINSLGAILIPVGATADRPSDTNSLGLTAQLGQIRYNSDISSYEGFGAGDAWASLGGIKDVDQDTYIIAEDSPNADNDELDFVCGGTEIVFVSGGPTAAASVGDPAEGRQLSPSINDGVTLGSSTNAWSTTYTQNLIVNNDVAITDAMSVGGKVLLGSTGSGTASVEVELGASGGMVISHGETNPHGVENTGDNDCLVIGGGKGGVGAPANTFTGQFALHGMHDGGDGNYNGALAFLSSTLDTTEDPDRYEWLERMRIAANGHVGIGTSSPSDKVMLQLQDTSGDVILGIDAESGSGDSVLALRNNTRIWNVGMDNSDDDKLVIAVGGNWNNIRPEADRHVMTMTYSGRVGIGTIAPSNKLHVGGLVGGTPSEPTYNPDGIIKADSIVALSGSFTGNLGDAPFEVTSSTKVTNLNAEFVDGISGESFLRSDANDTCAGSITFQNNIDCTNNISGAGTLFKINTTTRSTDPTFEPGSGEPNEGNANGFAMGIYRSGTEKAGFSFAGVGWAQSMWVGNAWTGAKKVYSANYHGVAAGLDAGTLDTQAISVPTKRFGAIQNVQLGGDVNGGIYYDFHSTNNTSGGTTPPTGYNTDYCLRVQPGSDTVAGLGTSSTGINETLNTATHLWVQAGTAGATAKRVLTQADEGPTNGLDADTTDGQHLGTTHGVKHQTFAAGTAPIPNTSTYPGWIYASGDVVFYYSDRRLKTNVTPISDALYKVNRLSGFTYQPNELANSLGGYNTSTMKVGVFADEVEEVLPEAVTLAGFDADFDETGKLVSKSGDDYKTVQYEKLVPLLIESIKELTARVEELESR